MTITKNTGWKNPGTVTQYAKYDGKSCSAWSRLETVKIDEPSSNRDYDLSAVCYNLTSSKRSALMYCYNMGFNIPSKATITKILVKTCTCQDNYTSYRVYTKLLKLKVGANTTDSGVGNNLAPNIAWRTRRRANNIGMEYMTVGDSSASVKSTWGVEVTPATVNNSNFGIVFQCGGTGYQKHKAYVDNIQIAIEYTLPEETAIIKPAPVEPIYSIDTSLSTVKYDTLTPSKVIEGTVIRQPYDSTAGYHFWVKFKNNAQKKENTSVIVNQNSKTVILETDGRLMFSGGVNQSVVPSVLVKGTSDSRYLVSTVNCIEQFYDVYVFPNITDFNSLVSDNADYIESVVKLYSTKIVNGKTVKDTELDRITLEIDSSTSNIGNSQTIIESCTFINNHSNKGAAIYNLGRLYIKNLTFKDNHTHGTGRNNCQFFDVDICRDKEFE